MVRTICDAEQFRSLVGAELGASDWFTITQARIDAFADVTEDWQWIHVDQERARAEGLGGTLAHGYLLLALVPRLSSQLFEFATAGRAINYGLDRVRFLTPIAPGDRIRLRADVLETRDLERGGVLGRVSYTLEVEGGGRPAFVAQALMTLHPAGEPA